MDNNMISNILSDLVDVDHIKRYGCSTHFIRPLPDKETLRFIIKEVAYFVFPDHYPHKSDEPLEDRLFQLSIALKNQIMCGKCFKCKHATDATEEKQQSCNCKAKDIAEDFIKFLPQLKLQLLEDANAAYLGDPAATSIDEVIFTYPGIVAMLHYRIAHFLFEHQVPIIPRFISEICHAKTGIDIHPGAKISPGLFIDHGTGVVIGETAVIGHNVKIYQGVTLGAKSFVTDENGHPVKGVPRHPTIEDDVTIYAGATILGRITIGKGAVIGGNVWVTESVEPGKLVTQKR